MTAVSPQLATPFRYYPRLLHLPGDNRVAVGVMAAVPKRMVTRTGQGFSRLSQLARESGLWSCADLADRIIFALIVSRSELSEGKGSAKATLLRS